MAPMSGLAIAGERPTAFDVMLVLDVSGSTEYPSGIDVDNDGKIGQTQRSITPGVGDMPNDDPDDSILSAEVAASKALLDQLDPQRVHIGVASFSGEVDTDDGPRDEPRQRRAARGAAQRQLRRRARRARGRAPARPDGRHEHGSGREARAARARLAARLAVEAAARPRRR